LNDWEHSSGDYSLLDQLLTSRGVYLAWITADVCATDLVLPGWKRSWEKWRHSEVKQHPNRFEYSPINCSRVFVPLACLAKHCCVMLCNCFAYTNLSRTKTPVLVLCFNRALVDQFYVPALIGEHKKYKLINVCLYNAGQRKYRFIKINTLYNINRCI
jgi:hypothetical protein